MRAVVLPSILLFLPFSRLSYEKVEIYEIELRKIIQFVLRNYIFINNKFSGSLM